MRSLGLDLGTKTIGLALSDELGITAQGLTTWRRQSLRKDLEMLTALADDREVERYVVGLPLNMDGTEGPRAEATKRFGAALEEKSGRPVLYWDERLTTVAAHGALLEADVSRARRREVVDQIAAVLILQSWMDSRRPLPSPASDDEDSTND